MNNHQIDFEQLSRRIQELLYDYVAVKSTTNTPSERATEDFFRKYIQGMEYFSSHPDYWGLFPLAMDGLGRNVCWAMVRGEGTQTVVLLHHYDVVDIEDYKTLKPFAYAPDQLRQSWKSTGICSLKTRCGTWIRGTFCSAGADVI